MKKRILIMCLMITGLSFSQSNENVTNNTSQSMLRTGVATQSGYGSSTMFYNNAKKAQGSVYLFKNWDNLAVIHTGDQQKFSLKNINLNIERNVFESKISEDSIFTFNFNNIDRFVVSNRVFKSHYYDSSNRVFEVIYESGKLTLLKGYKIQLVKGSPNPMLNRSTDKNVQKQFYFIKNGNVIEPFKLKKSNILGLMSSEQAKYAEDYAKTNRLSFKKDVDVNRILTHGFSN